MKMRLFGSDVCPLCEIALLKLKCEKEIEYEYIDAHAEGNQQLCDDNDVNELPHIQVFDDYETDKVAANFIGSDVLTMLKWLYD